MKQDTTSIKILKISCTTIILIILIIGYFSVFPHYLKIDLSMDNNTLDAVNNIKEIIEIKSNDEFCNNIIFNDGTELFYDNYTLIQEICINKKIESIKKEIEINNKNGI